MNCHPDRSVDGALGPPKDPRLLFAAHGLTSPAITFALLTPVVLLVHVYHPLADDGAVYVAGIKKLVNPSLYQADAIFVSSPTQLSIFAHVLAALFRWGHIPLPLLLLGCHLASIFLFLLGSWKLATR